MYCLVIKYGDTSEQANTKVPHASFIIYISHRGNRLDYSDIDYAYN